MQSLQDGLDRRLDELAAARPDLDRALALQRVLLRRQIELLDVIRDGGLPRLVMPPGYIAAKLAHGVPILHGEPIPLPSALLAMAAREFCEHLASGGAGEIASAVGRAFDTHALDAGALLSACFGRDQRRVRSLSAQAGVAADLTWLVSELALAPFAYLLQCRALAPDQHVIAAALRAWDRGFCPACGSWPAVIEGGNNQLRCSFCALAWQLSQYRCLYCGNATETFITAAPDPDNPGRRLQLCGGCGGYVKVIDVTTEFPLVAVEDLASMDLDMVAMERKYLRPPLPEIKRR